MDVFIYTSICKMIWSFDWNLCKLRFWSGENKLESFLCRYQLIKWKIRRYFVKTENDEPVTALTAFYLICEFVTRPVCTEILHQMYFQTWKQVRYYVEHCSLGDWLVLYQMARNMNKRFFAEFLYVLARFIFFILNVFTSFIFIFFILYVLARLIYIANIVVICILNLNWWQESEPARRRRLRGWANSYYDNAGRIKLANITKIKIWNMIQEKK